MPWKESSVMDERLRFIARPLEGEAMTNLCVEFAISRKTGYKIYQRYRESGAEALTDRSRKPYRYANQLPPQLEAQIVGLKRDKPHWGARKIRELLVRRLPGDIKLPANSTIHAVLDRNGLVKRMGRRRGISIERIKPRCLAAICSQTAREGNPQQNGRHERMHRTLKQETTRPAGMNSLQQQARFDAFQHRAPA